MFTGFKVIHVAAHTVPAYSYKRRFTVKDKPEKTLKTKAPSKRASKNVTVRKPRKKGYKFAVPSTGISLLSHGSPSSNYTLK